MIAMIRSLLFGMLYFTEKNKQKEFKKIESK